MWLYIYLIDMNRVSDKLINNITLIIKDGSNKAEYKCLEEENEWYTYRPRICSIEKHRKPINSHLAKTKYFQPPVF